ncbi:SDR family oxidoreductase [Saccharicrinis fermentans]|uniref:Putative oxidoreductase n=1 Tax=Saccharicrinis fermentans DSM 9555 = JCM 21142 TaxID=869213 RepID=W7YA87_9BACT|nr:SDR family oxidoreductase [Saccharicrinis fermentans]GAF04478.1 putative oxidoreductase [Saccharicrinis fermentans DSM 9555 = JCM 21142]
MKDLKDKVVWITGASSGIGEELAYALAREGARLVLTARNKAQIEKVKSKCLLHTSYCWIQLMDLSKVEQIDSAVKEVLEQTGKIDVLINNAGRSQRSLAKHTPLGIDRSIMELNFFSMVALTKSVLPSMLHHGSGHIVAVSSITGKFGFPWRTAYAASKHAVQGFFESLRAELNQDHIHVTIVSPGRIKTDISLKALTENGQAYNIMDKGQLNGMGADACARQIVKAIKKNRKDILVGRQELGMVYIRKLWPSLYHRLVLKIKN